MLNYCVHNMAKLTTVCSNILVIFAIIGSCVALECYSCDGYGQCVDPFSGNITVTCSENETMCTADADRDNGRYDRSCATPSMCNKPTGCVVWPGTKGVCSYCCDGNLCNNRSVADEVEGVLNCYSCAYNTANGTDRSCLDPLGEGRGLVKTVPCDDACSLNYKSSPSSEDFDNITRECKSECTPGCDSSGSCTTCCTDNLCNGDSPTATQAIPTDQGNTTDQGLPVPTDNQGVTLTSSWKVPLLVFLGLYQTVFVICQ